MSSTLTDVLDQPLSGRGPACLAQQQALKGSDLASVLEEAGLQMNMVRERVDFKDGDFCATSSGFSLCTS